MQSVLRMYNLIPKKNGAAMSGTDFGVSQGDQNPENDYISRFETTLNLTCWVYFTAGARPRGLILVPNSRIWDATNRGFDLSSGATNTVFLRS